MEIQVFIPNGHPDITRIQAAVEIVNSLQGFARFKLTTTAIFQKNFADPSARRRSSTPIHRQIEMIVKGQPAVAIVAVRLEGNVFSDCTRRTMVITTADWEAYFAPPPLWAYLVYQLAAALVQFGADLPDNIPPLHDPSIGCVFDYCRDKELIRLGMTGAYICPECEMTLAGMGVSDRLLDAMNQLLAQVRAISIRKPRTVPNAVFIGHGRSSEWVKLRDYLVQSLGLRIEEFDQHSPAGMTVQQRLDQMLSSSRFALVVMTGDDLTASRRARARQNVIHEIGLCQGRLGFNRTVVLLQNGVEPFSNLSGIVYVGFSRGRIESTFTKIRDTLEKAELIGEAPPR